jgi:hypothetical protein
MKSLACVALVAFSVAIGIAADPKPTPTAPNPSAVVSSLAGKYLGIWQSAGGDGGELELNFKPDAGNWAVDASFTFQGAKVPTKVKDVKVNGPKVEMTFTYMIEDNPGETRLVGELADGKLTGTFQTRGSDDTNVGTWKAARN